MANAHGHCDTATPHLRDGGAKVLGVLMEGTLDLGHVYMTECAIDCVKRICATADVACVCENMGDGGVIVPCIEALCRHGNGPLARRLIAETCHVPVRNRTTRFILMNVLLGVVTVTTMVTRLVYKRFYSTKKRLMLDDWLIMAILVLGPPSVAINVFGLAFHGLGKDTWGVSLSDLEIFHEYFFVMEILYLTLLTLIKLTLSLFYLNIFPSAAVRKTLWGTVIFQVLFGVSFVVKTVFQCRPIQYYWSKYRRPASDGRCIDVNASGWANAAISIAVDVWLIAIPLAQIRKMRLHWKKKVAAGIMFLTGTIFTVVSILRLHSLVFLNISSNPLWDFWDILWWSTIEINIGIICTCLPSVRLMLVSRWPRIFGSRPSSDGRTPDIDTIALTTNNDDRSARSEETYASRTTVDTRGGV